MRIQLTGSSPVRFVESLAASLAGSLLWASALCAGGSGESAVLIVDPRNAESLYVANYYQSARALPAANVIYMDPDAPNYGNLAAVRLEGLLGSLENHGLGGIDGHVRYVILPPGDDFYVSIPNTLIADGCFPVNRLALSSAYGLVHQRHMILGGTGVAAANHYSKDAWNPRSLDFADTWFLGDPDTGAGAQRYLMGALLGYTGSRGNTLAEVLAMIDRSVAADATHPVGTAYFMQTTDTARSGPRHDVYPTAVTRLSNAGGTGAHLMAVLPTGEHDALGVMTGVATPAIEATDFTLLDGSFADHLTSFAGRFDTSSQTKMSRWITKGASGTSGTVEEPCNYAGKFPHARLHVVYYKGLTLGEAWLRSLGFLPFQQLFLGDPLTRPFSVPPLVDVPVPPSGPLAGTVGVTPSAMALDNNASILRLDLFVDGRSVETVGENESFSLDTTRLTDGFHELRVLAVDTKQKRNRARWIDWIEVDNHAGQVTLGVDAPTGDLTHPFVFTHAASGRDVRAVRLIQNGRVIASSDQATGSLTVHGQVFGAGTVTVQAEAEFVTGLFARSAPVELAIAFSAGTPTGSAPEAWDSSQNVSSAHAFVVQLPWSSDDDPSAASWNIVTHPQQATRLGGNGPWRVYQPDPGASGTDSLQFSVTTAAGTSAVRTVELRYDGGLSGTESAYGCATPAAELTLREGVVARGNTLILELDGSADVPGGALPFLVIGLQPAAPFPCGFSLFSAFGAPQQVLVSLEDVSASQSGPAWAGPGQAVQFELELPSGLLPVDTLYTQGFFIDTTSNPAGTRLLRLHTSGGLALELP